MEPHILALLIIRDLTFPVLGIAGGGIEELTPVWSPDGKSLYYIRDDGSGSMLVVQDLADDGAPRVILAHVGVAAFPKLARDGRREVLRSRDQGQFDVPVG